MTKPGARLLADYLAYADSGGTASEASGGTTLNPFEADVRDRLAECGITVVPQYGVGGYRVDFAAAHPDQADRMVLAIEANGASYRASGSVRDRDRLRGEHLQRLGWSFHRLWSTNWFRNPQAEVDKIRSAYDRATSHVPAAEGTDVPVGGTEVPPTADGGEVPSAAGSAAPAADGTEAPATAGTEAPAAAGAAASAANGTQVPTATGSEVPAARSEAIAGRAEAIAADRTRTPGHDLDLIKPHGEVSKPNRPST